MQTTEARQAGARALPCAPATPLRPAAASTLSPAWLQAHPAPAEVVAVFDQAIYLLRGQDVLPLLAPEALMLPGAVRVTTPADLDALRVRVGDEVLVGRGEVRTAGGGLVVRRVWRPLPVPTAPLSEAARWAAWAGLAGLTSLDHDDVSGGRLAELAAAVLDGPAAQVSRHLNGPISTEAVHGLVGLGPGLTPAGDDVLCGLLLGLRASGQERERSLLEEAVLPLLGRTTALSATLLRQAAQGYAVPPVVALLRAWHRGAGVPALASAGCPVAEIGHTSGPALILGLATALTAASTTPLTTALTPALTTAPSTKLPPHTGQARAGSAAPHPRLTSAPGTGPAGRPAPVRPQPAPVLVAGATRGTS
ncbi:DUF2877 domain-containing protein [Ornithinimicrobium sufpigmenti]|uniref:DUF2877 domain-containing protein n=1 Tax=Ornithinimicrobium sufpigmenti TaxID=2508882 RepID=UPI0015E194C8|nr:MULTISPECIES: DUF2877 domain-containing protein [unclassified Ornithinimicrobium]